jgi:beta-glucosidase
MKLRLTTLFILAAHLSFSGLQAQTTAEKVETLLQKMTLEEKVGQMNQYSSFYDVTGPAPEGGRAQEKYNHLKSGRVGSMLNVRGIENVRKFQKIAVEESRLGIPLLFAFDVIHGQQTLSPIPLAEAASWDLEAIERSAQVAATEAAAEGINWTFAPMVDVSRDARWGRVMEGAGEDTYLGSKIAVARVNGFQGDDLSNTSTIAACTKHFAGYAFVEAGREHDTVDIEISTLYNVVLPPFKAAVDAGVATVMNSSNELKGIPATGNSFLQREILKGEWGFEGVVVSDWASISEMIDYGFARDTMHAAELAATAGSDIDMEGYAYVKHLKTLVEAGKVDEKLIDDAVRRILTLKHKLGLFEDPYKYCDKKRQKEKIGHPDHHAAVLDMAKKSIVLLKNEGNLLPLDKGEKKIALIGPLADDPNSPLGNWRTASRDSSGVSVLAGMQKYKGNTLTFAKGAELVAEPAFWGSDLAINETDKSGFQQAINAAKDADIVIMVLGEHGFQSGEARNRTAIDLPGVQQALLEAVYEVNQNIVLVLMNGRPLAIPWAAEHIPTIVEAWQLGTQSGNAIAQVLYGDYNPGGKLPMTFPRSVGQVPLYYNGKNAGRPGPRTEGFWSHHIDDPNSPQFPFGHGLSYTTFAYSNLKVTPVGDKGFNVSVLVKNTGARAGEEVVQLYIHDPVASVTRPIKALKGFEKIMLKAGEGKIVTFKLGPDELGFFNNQRQFVVEPGTFHVMVGGSSVGGLTDSFELK